MWQILSGEEKSQNIQTSLPTQAIVTILRETKEGSAGLLQPITP